MKPTLLKLLLLILTIALLFVCVALHEYHEGFKDGFTMGQDFVARIQ